MKNRNILIAAIIIAVGIVLGMVILKTDRKEMKTDEHRHGASEARHEPSKEHAEEEGHEEAARGPHGGRLLAEGDFAVEMTIFEQGVPPEFRVYAYEAGKPVDPGEVQLKVTLSRLGTAPETIGFQKQMDYLRGDREVEEPHSFDVEVAANRKGKGYRWHYEQVEGRVRLDEATVKNSGMEVKVAGPARIRSILQLPGEIQFNQDRVAHVVPRLGGVVRQSLKNLGDPVRKGELLAVLDSQQLSDLKAEHLATEERLDLARKTFEREKRLWEEKISAEQDYLASRTALSEAEIASRNAEQKLLSLGLTHAALAEQEGGKLTRYEVRAPIDGVVIEKHLGLGEAIKEDASIFLIADLSTVWAEMTVYPKDLNIVKVGQKVTVRAAELNEQAGGTVSYVGPVVGEQTRSAKARVTLKNPEGRWRPGLFVTVDLVREEAKVPVAVSADAVQTYRDWKAVFVRFGDDFEARPVELGRSDGEQVEVVKGLASGTHYVGRGSYVIKAELGKAGASHDH